MSCSICAYVWVFVFVCGVCLYLSLCVVSKHLRGLIIDVCGWVHIEYICEWACVLIIFECACACGCACACVRACVCVRAQNLLNLGSWKIQDLDPHCRHPYYSHRYPAKERVGSSISALRWNPPRCNRWWLSSQLFRLVKPRLREKKLEWWILIMPQKSCISCCNGGW